MWIQFYGTGELAKRIEYIRVELKQSLGINFVSPFPSEREYKVYNSCKFSKIINYVTEYDPLTYPFQFLCFIKLFNNFPSLSSIFPIPPSNTHISTGGIQISFLGV